ncbi:MAG: lysophospholipase [Bacteroidetes bacterium]|nr:lysophospholipase [Bacteroidota bacterium]MDA1120252.1 lysophospholipase [Bacteroidota bacterium]
MKTEEIDLIGIDGEQLFGRCWLPEADVDPSIVICLIHGLYEHSGRYEAFSKFFTEFGIGVYSFDLRGHGLSPGKRGHIKNYSDYIDDVESLLKLARTEHNDSAIVLYGHSLGGNIVANYILKNNMSELTAAVLSSPWLQLVFEPPKSKLKLARIMNRIYPGYAEKGMINPEDISKDEDIVNAYRSDALNQWNISARLFLNALEKGKWAEENAYKLKIPTLVICGADDNIVLAEASRSFAEKSRGKAVHKQYPGVRHEPHNDIERKEILNDVLNWIQKQVK